MLLAALLAALAVRAGLGPRRQRRPLRALPQRPPPARGPWSDRAAVPACAFSGVVVLWLLGGLLGAVAGATLALGGPRLLARASTAVDDGSAGTLPLALDLLAACLTGGAPLGAATASVAEACPGQLGRSLARVAAALDVGAPAAEAWAPLSGFGPTGLAVARALARTETSGAPLAPTLRDLAARARADQAAAGLRRARRVGVLVVGPLGVCFLPAFLLVGVVPTVIGLAGPLFAAL